MSGLSSDASKGTRTVNFSTVVAEALLSGRADAIIAADRAGIIRFWNPGAERLFGYARQEALEQSLNLIIPERLRQRQMATTMSSRLVTAVTRTVISYPCQRSAKMVPQFTNKGRNGKVCRYGRSHARRHQTIPGDACTKAEAR
jgi:PAS domain-containing protein